MIQKEKQKLLEAVAKETVRVLKGMNTLIPAAALADTIKEVAVLDEDLDGEFFHLKITSIDVIEAVKSYPQELRYYGNLIGLVQREREFWFNITIDLLEKEGKSLLISEIVRRVRKMGIYESQFSVTCSNNIAENEILQLVVTFKNIFYKILDQNSLNDIMGFYSHPQIGLNQWRKPSIELLEEIKDILKSSNNKISIDRLLFKINNRGNFYKSDYRELTIEELKSELDKNKQLFDVEDGLLKLIDEVS